MFFSAKEKCPDDDRAFEHYLFRLMDNFGFFPTDLRRVEINLAPGSSETKYPEIKIPHRRNINLTIFIEQIFEILEKSKEKNPHHTQIFLEYFLKVVWQNELLDINPILELYVDYLKPSEVLETIRSQTYDFQKIYDWETDFKHLYSRNTMLEILPGLQMSRAEILNTKTKLKRTGDFLLSKIVDAYESCSYLVGFLVGLDDIKQGNFSQKKNFKYFLTKIVTSDGIKDIMNRKIMSNTRPLTHSIPTNLHELRWVFIDLFFSYYRPIRNRKAHKKNRYFDNKSESYLIEYSNWFREIFSLEELEEILLSLVSIFKITCATTFQFLRFPSRIQVLKTLDPIETENPLLKK